jgi:hypothetical protein
MEADQKYIRVHLRANWLAAIRDALVCQAQQSIAAAAHLDADFPQSGTLDTQAGRLAVDRAAQVAELLCGAFPEVLQLIAGTSLRGGRTHKTILA